MRQLCEGLCSETHVRLLEKGESEPGYLLLDRLLGRLGIGDESYEIYLGCQEYDAWADKMRLLYAVTHGQAELAEALFGQYRKTHNTRDRLERQFVISMEALLGRYSGLSGQKLYELYRQAAELTVPGWDTIVLREHLLSVMELNLILEAEIYRCDGARTERILEILEYIDGSGQDELCKANLYPKAVYYLGRTVLAAGFDERWTASRLLSYCEKAIDLLRSNGRLYYMWELLYIKELLLRQRIHEQPAYWPRGYTQEPELCKCLEETAAFKKALEELYDECGASWETVDPCYIYVRRGIYCLNDVIRTRRRMLQMSRKELCEGVCAERTLLRLENRRSSGQTYIVRRLFERLGLSGELIRTEIDTDDEESRRLMVKLRTVINNTHEWDAAEELLEKIWQSIPEKFAVNQQALQRRSAMIKWYQGKICAADRYQETKNALELTVPYESVLNAEEDLYLTSEEVSCIQNMMRYADRDSPEFDKGIAQLEKIYGVYAENMLYGNVNGMYEYVMDFVESVKGSRGELEESDKIIRVILTECVHMRRLHEISRTIYERNWNEAERVRRGIIKRARLDGRAELNKAILFSQMDRNRFLTAFYAEKLKAGIQ